MALEYEIAILPMVYLDSKRKFPCYTTHCYPGSLRVKVLNLINVEEIKSIESLQLECYELIKATLEKDTKGKSLDAIEVWKRKTG